MIPASEPVTSEAHERGRAICSLHRGVIESLLPRGAFDLDTAWIRISNAGQCDHPVDADSRKMLEAMCESGRTIFSVQGDKYKEDYELPLRTGSVFG